MDKNLVTGSAALLVLSLLGEKDRYGYEMIDTLAKRSDDTFAFKAGTLYPMLHTMEQQGMLSSYERSADGRLRKYYQLTRKGRGLLSEKRKEWEAYQKAIQRVLEGGAGYAMA